jgi:Fe2+ or Zn2+ uptake regulation protein
MSEGTPPDSFEDVNEAVADEWKDQTTPYERVREVISRTYEPTSAEEVADDALTSPKTARKHLETLASDGFVATTASETGGTKYRRAPDSLVMEQATELLSGASVDELEARASEMRRTLQEFQNRYDAQSPDELSIGLTNETLDGSPSRDEPDSEELTEWRTTRRNLALVNAALSIANARKFVTDDGSRSGRGAISHGD